jgi:hypothetical protein
VNDIRSLCVLDRLEIGPVGVERKRLVAPYTVVRDTSHESIDLIHRYEDTVFDPKDPQAINLASVIAARIVLNSRLICHEIVFYGPCDRSDRVVFEEMAVTTTREIYERRY